MAKGVYVSKKGIESVNRAEATPQAAYHDLLKHAAAIGISNDVLNEVALDYYDRHQGEPAPDETSWRLAFNAVMSQWVVRLMRFGGYKKKELGAVYTEFMELLSRYIDESPELRRDNASKTLECLYCSLRVRGVTDDQIVEAAREAFKLTAEDVTGDTLDKSGLSGVDTVGALKYNICGLYAFGLSTDEIIEYSQAIWDKMHSGEVDERFVWKNALFGALLQWMYVLATEVGLKDQLEDILNDFARLIERGSKNKDTRQVASEAFESYYAWLTVMEKTDALSALAHEIRTRG